MDFVTFKPAQMPSVNWVGLAVKIVNRFAKRGTKLTPIFPAAHSRHYVSKPKPTEDV